MVARSTATPRRYTAAIRRVFVMSSSGLASSTSRSAFFPAAMRAGVGHAQERGAVARGRDDHLRRRHAGGHHVVHLDVRRPGGVAVGADGDGHAGIRQLLQVARLDAPGGVHLRPIGGRRLQLGHLAVGQAALQPAVVGRDAAIGHVGDQHDVRPRLDQGDDFVVGVDVADAVGEGVEAGLEQALGIGQVEDVGGDAELGLVGLVDHRPCRSRASSSGTCRRGRRPRS